MKAKYHLSIRWLSCILLIILTIGILPSFPVNAVDGLVVIDDFEDGDASDWGFFGGNLAGGGGGVLSDRPYEGAYYFSTGWGGEGSASVFYGGFFKNMPDAAQITPPVDPVFNVWVLNQSNATVDEYTLEITIREDLDGNGWTDGAEDSFRLDTTFTSAQFDDQWTLISAPVSSFMNLGTGGDGTFDGNLDEIVVVVSGVSGVSGSTVEVDFDLFSFTTESSDAIIDDFESGLPSGTDGDGVDIGFLIFNDPNSPAPILTTITPPEAVPDIEEPNLVLQLDLDVEAWAGFVHNFENETVDTWVSQDWSAYEGISFWLYGTNRGVSMFLDVLDNRNPGSTTDDAERWTFSFVDNFSGWQEIKIPFTDMTRKEIGNGAPNDGFGLTEVHGYGLGTLGTDGSITYYLDNVSLYGTAPERPLTVGFSMIDYNFTEGETAIITAKLSKPVDQTVTVRATTEYGTAVADRDYVPTSTKLIFQPNETLQSFAVETIDDDKYQGDRGVVVSLTNPTGEAALGLPPIARLTILDNESYDPNLLDDFETYPYLWQSDKKVTLSNPEIPAGDSLALPDQDAYEHVLEVAQKNGKGTYFFSRTFPIEQNWSLLSGVNFWYYGQNSGKDIGLNLYNFEQQGKVDPSKWQLVWRDEFNDKIGTSPDTMVWGHEYGDGTAYGIPGWGNDELEFYTLNQENVATDGKGNLQITARESDGSLMCYYGPCEYTSARLLTKNRFEIAYGRLEARVKVPEGAGLWPAFWMLGTDIDEVGWPQTGEIDIMEYVGREPEQIFGTLHGPGYSGGESYGQLVEVGEPVADSFHTFAIEWQPDTITWFFDGEPYFTATPDDDYMLGKQWVFNHPFYILMNVAVGGNFGGPVGEDTTFPQSMLVDYVRLYQAKTKPLAFSATFEDDFSGWQKIELPFTAFTNDTNAVLDLNNIRGLAFTIPAGLRKPVMIDQINLSCASEITVMNVADSGPGSLRTALDAVCSGGTVTFDPDLAGQTISLTTGPLTLGKNVTVDGSDAPGITISGSGMDRVFIINSGTYAELSHLNISDGYGWELAGGILNNGALILDHVNVTDNVMATEAGDFWQGGGGIYNGEWSTLDLIDSSVSDNQAGWSGGGIYAFFNTTTTIIRSTISGNVSNDVGGAIRSLGNMTITNSTISGNTTTGWHGGAIFMTDGDITIINSTIANNIAPDWAPSAIFIGDYGGNIRTLTLANTIITGNQSYACEKFASDIAGNVVSLGHNLLQDDTCNPVDSDLIVVDALLGPLANNGGPTLTHALQAGSQAIDAGDDAYCPETDQRGVLRPQGDHCDIGAYEAE